MEVEEIDLKLSKRWLRGTPRTSASLHIFVLSAKAFFLYEKLPFDGFRIRDAQESLSGGDL